MTTPEEETEFYAAIGKAITSWQELEFSLGGIFGALTRMPDLHLAYLILLAPTNFNTQLGMISHAVERSGLHADQKTEWESLTKNLGATKKRRDVLAHAHIWRDASGKLSAAHAFKGDPSKGLSIKEINTAQESINHSKIRTAKFLSWITTGTRP